MSVITTAANFVEKAKAVHGDTYDYSKTIYRTAKIKVTIICSTHGEFLQQSNHHLKGQGCPKCGIKKCAKNISVPFEEFVERARQKHGDKFQYVKESYVDIKSKMTILCPEHGEMNMTGQSHCVSSHGCRRCGDKERAIKKTISKETFLETCKKIHQNKYSYEHVEYKVTNDKIKIICPKHGLFTQEANKHYHGAGCRKCADDEIGNRNRKTTEQFLTNAKVIWGDTYDYSLVDYVDSNTKVKIICSIHGIFEKNPSEHIHNQQGCQLCVSKRFSKLGTLWLNYMCVSYTADIQFNGNLLNDGEHRIANSLYHADGYCKETNTIFEFHGSYWHGDPTLFAHDKVNKHNGKTFGELYQNTLKKMEHCRENGYTVVECWESAWLKGIKAVKKLQRAFRKRNK